MNLLLILVLSLQLPQASFARFTFCKQAPKNGKDKQCVIVSPEGKGYSQLERNGGEPMQFPLTLSTEGREKLLSLVAGTNSLEKSAEYETKKKVADLGRKHLTLETPQSKREADYNYSDLKEVNDLTTFFEGLLVQQTFAMELGDAIRQDRLSIPERLEKLRDAVKSGRLGDPKGMLPLMDQIIQDDRILDYARTNAQQIKTSITTPGKGGK